MKRLNVLSSAALALSLMAGVPAVANAEVGGYIVHNGSQNYFYSFPQLLDSYKTSRIQGQGAPGASYYHSFDNNKRSGQIVGLYDKRTKNYVDYNDAQSKVQAGQDVDQVAETSNVIVSLPQVYDVQKLSDTNFDATKFYDPQTDSAVTSPDVVSIPPSNTTPTPTPTPAVTNITINTGYIEGGETMTLTGTNLSNVSSVVFGNVETPAQASTAPNSITVKVPAHAEGAVSLTLKDKQGTSIATNLSYTYLNVTPTFSTISPNAGTINGGQSVTINGTGLKKVKQVTFDGVAAQIQGQDDSVINVITPSHAAGSAALKFYDVNGTEITSPGLTYTYNDVPAVVNSLSHTSGNIAGGDEVGLMGTGLSKIKHVQFDGVEAQILDATDYQIIVKTPAHAAATANVTVSDVNNSPITQSATLTFQYEDNAPSISSVNPTTVTTGDSITINGNELKKVTKVLIGSQQATFNIVDNYGLNATIPAQAPGSYPVVVVYLNNGTETQVSSPSPITMQ